MHRAPNATEQIYSVTGDILHFRWTGHTIFMFSEEPRHESQYRIRMLKQRPQKNVGWCPGMTTSRCPNPNTTSLIILLVLAEAQVPRACPPAPVQLGIKFRRLDKRYVIYNAISQAARIWRHSTYLTTATSWKSQGNEIYSHHFKL